MLSPSRTESTTTPAHHEFDHQHMQINKQATKHTMTLPSGTAVYQTFAKQCKENRVAVQMNMCLSTLYKTQKYPSTPYKAHTHTNTQVHHTKPADLVTAVLLLMSFAAPDKHAGSSL